MAAKKKNLSDFSSTEIPNACDMKFGIVVAEWNKEVTAELCNSAIKTITKQGGKEDNICIKHVPGTFELSLGAQFFAEYTDVDAVIVLGVVIQGETRHFDFICQGVTQGITDVNLKYNIPIVFGVLTTDTMEQALDRAGGKHGNKGDEAAVTAIKMVALQNAFIDKMDPDDLLGDDLFDDIDSSDIEDV